MNSVGDYFLFNCPSITCLNLPSLKSTGNFFLAECSGLTCLNVEQLTSVGSEFLKDSTNIKEIIVGTNNEEVVKAIEKSKINLTIIEITQAPYKINAAAPDDDEE